MFILLKKSFCEDPCLAKHNMLNSYGKIQVNMADV